VDVAIEDLVVVGPNGDTAFGPVFDFKAVNDVVAAVDVDGDVAIGSVLSVNHSAAGNFGFEGNGTRAGAALAEVEAPTAIVVGVSGGFHDDGVAGRSKAVRLDDSSQRLGRCSGRRITTGGGHIQSCTVRVGNSKQTD